MLIEFVVFEPANLLLSSVTIVYEKLVTGMRTKRIDIVSEYIFPSSGSSLREFYRLCILLWSIIILLLVILEAVKVFKHGFGYFKTFFNWISFLQLSSSSCAVLLVCLKDNGLRDFLQTIRDDPFGSWSAYELIKWASIGEVILSVTIVITTIKCLKLIKFNRHVHVMKWTLEAAYRYLCSFSFVILILALAFAHLGTLLFGSKDEEYATLYNSLRSVLKMAIGIGKLRSKLGGGSQLQLFAPIFLMACMLSMTIIFTDTFVAILNKAYYEASGREYPGEELGVYIKQRFKDGIKRSSRKPPFRKSFQSSIRRKRTSPKFPKCEIQTINVNDEACHVRRAQLPETESLLSYEISYGKDDVNIPRVHGRYATNRNLESLKGNISQSPKREKRTRNEDYVLQWTKTTEHNLFTYEDFGEQNVKDIQTVYEKETDRNRNAVRMYMSDAIYNENVMAGCSNDESSCLKFPPTEEELLLGNVKEAMKNSRSELAKYSCKDGDECDKYTTSISSRNSSLEGWNDECSHHEPKNVSDEHDKKQSNLALNVRKSCGHTVIEVLQESHV